MQNTILSTPSWYQTLATLADHIGTKDFPHFLAQACQEASPYDSTLIIAFMADKRPLKVYDNLPREHADASMTPYFSGAYLLDPFYALYKNKAPSGVYRLKDVAPDSFYESEYHRSYYAGTGLKDEAGLLIDIGTEVHVLISLGGRDDEHVSSTGEFSKLQTITPLLVSLCRQHWQCIKDKMGNADQQIDDTLGRPLDMAFKNFGKDFLSNRECEVVQLILKGHSSKSIARLLEISEDTVKVHRKRFHAKLEISSQAELFSLFLEAIALVPMGSEEDPLSFYFNGERTTASPA